jgi:dipeptidyl-peptidase-4
MTPLLAPNYQYYINTFSSSAQATTYSLNEAKTGTQIKVIENNAALVKLKDYNLPDKEFFCLKPKKGNELNAWIMKPKDFDASKNIRYLCINTRTRFSASSQSMEFSK